MRHRPPKLRNLSATKARQKRNANAACSEKCCEIKNISSKQKNSCKISLPAWKAHAPPAALGNSTLLPENSKLRNSKLLFRKRLTILDLDPWLTPEPGPCSPDPKRVVPPTDRSRNSKLGTRTFFRTEPEPEPTLILLPETENQEPKTENQLFNGPKPPPPGDETSRRADELFEISHGYKRNNPPKTIPNRRLEEDFRSRSIFGDVKNVLKYM